MADEAVAATVATEVPATTTVPAATALPPEFEAQMKQLGFNDPKDLLYAAGRFVHAGTPQGYQELVAVVAEREGATIAKAVLEANPDAVLGAVNGDTRRKIRRAGARRDAAAGVPVQDDDVDDTPNPAEEAKATAKEAKDLALAAQAETRTAARAVALAPQLVTFATKDPRIAQHFTQFSEQASRLLDSGHPKYQGPGGVEAARDDVLASWEKFGAMAGMKRPTPASPEKGGDAPVPTREDASKAVEKALEASRGQGSGSFVDSLMKGLGL